MFWIYLPVITFFATIFIGALFQCVSTLIDDFRHPPLGTLVDVGGNKLHVFTSGNGSPTVICDAGLGGTSLGWTFVQSELSKFTRVCSYDRAGYAWSEVSPSKRTSANIVEELHTLLQKANIPSPYILVGHSFGGCNMLLFAHQYPEETLAVVLVDSVQEEMLKQLPAPRNQGMLDRILEHPRVQWVLSVIGYKRLKGPSAEINSMFKPLPENIRLAYIAQMNKTGYTTAVSSEMACLEMSLAQLAAATIHLQDKPLIVITAGKNSDSEEAAIWHRLQKHLLLKSNQSKQIFSDESDHMINHHQPKIIVNAILEIIKNHSKNI